MGEGGRGRLGGPCRESLGYFILLVLLLLLFFFFFFLLFSPCNSVWAASGWLKISSISFPMAMSMSTPVWSPFIRRLAPWRMGSVAHVSTSLGFVALVPVVVVVVVGVVAASPPSCSTRLTRFIGPPPLLLAAWPMHVAASRTATRRTGR